MDKNAIKKYAVWARTELIERVTQKALQYGISEKDIIDANADSINGKLLTDVEKKQRRALISKINDKGFEQVMEEVAYTWFNRFSALRFMEVNGYLPSHVRVFTDEDNNFKPQILTEAIHLEIDGLDMDKVYSFKEENKNEELYKYLLIVQCNALNKILPGMFQKISDYTELLLPDNLLREGSVIQQMIDIIPEEDWKDAVQIIGWLYQYYNSEPKDQVFNNLKKNIKITKENIPAATQMFTPDWIVRYMVENSLGRLWLEGHPDDTLKSKWKYYLDEAKQEDEVKAQLDTIREEYKNLRPDKIRVIDCCMGSGHILVYVFDVLIQIYEAYGYTTHEAVMSIVDNNIWGLDIDERAAQLANFAIMMKARQYDRRFFSRGLQPHVYAILESNHIDKNAVDYFVNGDTKLKTVVDVLIEELYDAKEYGSILNVSNVDFDMLYTRFNDLCGDIHIFNTYVMEVLLPFIQVAQVMAQKYDLVITNPPYMGSSNMGQTLSEYVKHFYPDTKPDLSTVFMEKALEFCNSKGFISMINIPVWMNLAGCVEFRKTLISKNTLINMLHFGRGVFGSDFGSTAFVFAKKYYPNYRGVYRRLFLKQGAVDTVEQKEQLFFDGIGTFNVKQINYLKVPGYAFAYQVGEKVYQHFSDDNTIGDFAVAKQGLITGNNDKFMRYWFEISQENMTLNCESRDETKKNEKKWYPYNKGGEFRKWYGNCWYVVDWYNDGYEIQHYNDEKGKLRSRPQNMAYYFKEGLSWTALTAGKFSMRFSPQGFLFDAMGPVCFTNKKDDEKYVLGLLNSKVGTMFLRILCPNLKFDQKPLENVPCIINEKSEIEYYVDSCIEIAKSDWDSFETSWDYEMHPFLKEYTGKYISEASNNWNSIIQQRRNYLKTNEEYINRKFIEMYGLEDSLDYFVGDEDMALSEVDVKRDVINLISYAVSCMFGRYSLDVVGLAYTGGEWEASKYSSYPADEDNIIPICDDEYFDDDIVGRFVKFVETVYGKETLDENLKFIADALGGKGSQKDIIRNYFLNNFFADHCKTYQKRPIYWLFDSGKKNGFKCLIYMHRYQPDTIARIRTDYVHEQQARYRTAISDLEQRINSATTSERVKLNKQLTKLKDQESELRTYEEKIHHLADQMIPIDLDDGVKVNYAKFQDVLAKIK